jgi:hypothetical protein
MAVFALEIWTAIKIKQDHSKKICLIIIWLSWNIAECSVLIFWLLHLRWRDLHVNHAWTIIVLLSLTTDRISRETLPCNFNSLLLLSLRSQNALLCFVQEWWQFPKITVCSTKTDKRNRLRILQKPRVEIFTTIGHLEPCVLKSGTVMHACIQTCRKLEKSYSCQSTVLWETKNTGILPRCSSIRCNKICFSLRHCRWKINERAKTALLNGRSWEEKSYSSQITVL